MNFLDEAKICLRAGKGGNGCVSFRREKFVPHGGPNGGNGGHGGSVVIKAVNNINTLLSYRYQKHFKAPKGEHGQGRDRSGSSGKDLILNVPIGTEIFAEDKETQIADLTKDDQSVTIAYGGKGGLGNANFKSSTNQAPRKFTEGELGEEIWIYLKLKLISDVGIIGLPNAGKSTLLSVISSAKPKIANYPFTTLKPQLGIVEINYDAFVVADIPGLIEGASTGLGLGDRFLKHIERCNIVLHLIDINSQDIYADYEIIKNELNQYSAKLSQKKEIIALNKIDCLDIDKAENIQKEISEKLNKQVLLISAAQKNGLNELKRFLYDNVKQKP